VPGAIVCPRPEQLVRSTPLLPCGMPKDAKRGRHVRWPCGRALPFEIALFIINFASMDLLNDIFGNLLSELIVFGSGYFLSRLFKKNYFSVHWI
jgi:hypothetical protein